MSDWRCKPPAVLAMLGYMGYKVWYEANLKYRAVAPDGKVIYYGDDETDAWTACNLHFMKRDEVQP